jgi:hypothetical protein
MVDSTCHCHPLKNSSICSNCKPQLEFDLFIEFMSVIFCTKILCGNKSTLKIVLAQVEIFQFAKLFKNRWKRSWREETRVHSLRERVNVINTRKRVGIQK